MMIKNNKMKSILVFGGGGALLFLFSWLHLFQSAGTYTSKIVLEAVMFQGDTVQHEIVRSIYLPRIAIGILAGASLAVAGVLFQTLTKNPLASPATLGVNAGAYFFVVLGAVLLPSAFFMNGFVMAFAGGALAAIFVFVMSGGFHATPVKMALAGMILTLLFSSLTSIFQIFYETETSGLFLWGNGSLVQQDWRGVLFAIPILILVTCVALLLSGKMDILLLGEEKAASLGENIKQTQVVLFILAVGLTATTVSVVGPIGFVGLIAPHLMRLIGFRKHRPLILASLLWGANILLFADILGRVLDPTLKEVPVGSVTALIGAPWLIYLIFRHRSMFRRTKETMTLGGSNRKKRIPYKWLIVLGLAGLVISFIFGVVASGQGLQWAETWQALTNPDNHGLRFIVLELRMSRVLVALVCGLLLAMSGLIFQGILRNPLADPSVLGVTAGAGMGAILVLFLFTNISVALLPVGAIAGAVLAIAIVLILGWKLSFQPSALALIGIAVSSFASAIIQLFITRFNMNAAGALTWLSGSTYATGFPELQLYLLIPLLILLPVSFIYMKRLNVLGLGEDEAVNLGENVSQTRIVLAIIATVAAASSVAAVGTIGFVGLVAPHLARLLSGYDNRKIYGLSLLFGGILLVVADTFSRVILFPKEIPSGLVVALIGAPLFLWLMNRQHNR